MSDILDAIRTWLTTRYTDYKIESEISGTYGLIFVLTALHDIHPKSFAIKTIDPKLLDPTKRDHLADLQREFRLWLELRQTYNVLPAIGFDIAEIYDGDSKRHYKIPMMRMPKMDGSLQDWIDKPSLIPLTDRLIALAQALNGLKYLYDHGLEGHGDLKPSNILYEDIAKRTILQNTVGWPSQLHPFCIRIADLGWADAWIDLGLTNMALRQYRAPERFEQKFVPEKSDMFSMGIIAAELIQGHHPAANLKKVSSSDGKWTRWASSNDKLLNGIPTEPLKNIIFRCLDADPHSRPTALEFFDVVCDSIYDLAGIDTKPVLELWRIAAGDNSPIAKADHRAWTTEQAQRLGNAQAENTLTKLLTELQNVAVTDFASCEVGASLAQTYVRAAPQQPPNAEEVRELAKHFIGTILSKLNRNDINNVERRTDLPSFRGFERYAQLLGNLFAIAGLPIQEQTLVAKANGNFMLSASYYAQASEQYAKGNNRQAIQLLSRALEADPTEPTNYYFRARWRLITNLLTRLPPTGEMNDDVLKDLHAAIKLDPEWQEPYQFLDKLTLSSSKPN